jgi:hypothetical protein
MTRVLIGIVAVLMASVGVARASFIALQFTPSTYQIIDAFIGGCPNVSLPCGVPDDSTLTVSITGPKADFSTTDSVNPNWDIHFTLPNYLQPLGYEPGQSPYYKGAGLTNADWNTAVYPFVTFWSLPDGGAFSIASSPDENGNILVDFFSTGTNPFSLVVVPEPAAWTLMILGVGATGGMLRRRRALAARKV